MKIIFELAVLALTAVPAGAAGQAHEHGRRDTSPVKARLLPMHPLDGPLRNGLLVLPVQVEGVALKPVYGEAGMTAAPAVGHLHLKLDGTPWHWVQASSDAIVIQNLPAGNHQLRIDLADPMHRVIDTATVEFVIESKR